jgi:allophanate hydrolase
LPDPPQPAPGAIRIVAGPQADHFAAETLAAFVDADYRVSSDADRMGVRLEGPALLHQGPAEIVSDATVPGAIQVPGNGQPIVLLNDAQTAGGYPKIATVVSADLPRLAACASGARLRFTWVDAAAGEQLARAAEAELLVLLASMRPLPAGGVDLAALYACNLISGVVDGMPPGLARA